MEPRDINFAAIPQTAVNVVTKPSEFFQSMPKTGGFLKPLVFVVIMGLICGCIRVVINIIGFGPYVGYGVAIKRSLDSVVYITIVFAICSFIGAAILFVIWKLMGSQENYETAYRCGAYLTALVPITSIIDTVPYAGYVINPVIYVFFLVMASVHVHNLPSQKAWLVFGVIIAIFAVTRFYEEYRNRPATLEMNRWQMGKYARKRAEKMAEQFRKQSQETNRQTE